MTHSSESAKPVKPARVLLVDEHAVVRFGLSQLLSREPDLVACGEEADAAGALAAVGKLKPDVVVSALSLKGSSGLEFIRQLKVRHPRMPVLVFSLHDEGVYAEAALRAGALGYVMKREPLERILEGIRQVLKGAVFVSDSVAVRLLQKQIRASAYGRTTPQDLLSARELEVFLALGQWKTARQIAQELHLSPKTVEYFRHQIKRKLRLKSAVEVTQHATTWVQREHPV
jgi:DNA-binding NarL/FixJ family response regulator